MLAPDITNVLNDPNAGVTYKVMAYRQLTKAELLNAAGNYLSTHKRPKKGSIITIVTVIE